MDTVAQRKEKSQEAPRAGHVGRMPWVFFVDVLLATAPFINARNFHDLWSAIAVYLLVLAILRSWDNVAVRKHWRLWHRVAVKVVIFIAAEAIVAISALETCDATGSNCHRVFY